MRAPRTDTSILSPARLAEALNDHAWVDYPALPGRRNHLRCGVLVALRWRPEPEVLVTRRPQGLKHGGEWCFPGGRPEANDDDLYATACREGREELGLSHVSQLGRLSSMPIGTSDYRLEPFVVEVHDSQVTPDPGEVAECAALPLLTLIGLPELQSLPFTWEGSVQRSPIFPLGDRYLFGATAHTLMELIRVGASALGVEGPVLGPTELTWEVIVAATRS